MQRKIKKRASVAAGIIVLLCFLLCNKKAGNERIPEVDSNVMVYEPISEHQNQNNEGGGVYAEVSIKECYFISDSDGSICFYNSPVNTTDSQYEILNEEGEVIFNTGRMKPAQQVILDGTDYFDKGKTNIVIRVNSFIEKNQEWQRGNSFTINSMVQYL